MNPFMIVSKAVGEYPELDKRLKSVLAYIKDRIRGIYTPFFRLPISKKETEIVNSRIKGIGSLEVRLDPSHDRNAYVLPGMSASYLEKYLSKGKTIEIDGEYYVIPGVVLAFRDSIQALKKLERSKVTTKIIDGVKTVEFTSVDVEISVFSTYGTLTHMPVDQRIAVYLHEIGHWIEAASSIPDKMLEDDAERLYYASYRFISGYLTRYAEYEADKFAWKCGFGEELKAAFDSLVDTRKNVHFIAKMRDAMFADQVELQNKMEEHGADYDVSHHPSMKKRKEWLDKYEKERSSGSKKKR